MKRILYAGLILLVGLGGGVAVNGWSHQVAVAEVALAIGYMLGVVAMLGLERGDKQ